MPLTDPYLVVGSHQDQKTLVSLSIDEAEWQFISFAVVRLGAGESVSRTAEGEEIGLVLLSGRACVVAGNAAFNHLGKRTSVFEGKPFAVYLPPGTTFTISAESDLEIAIAGARADSGPDPYLIKPDEIQDEIRGKHNAERTIRHVLEADRPASRLFLVECITPSGRWSSYPPHKHDRDDYPNETYLEETYYHRLNPPSGFAMQRVYTDPESGDAIVVHDGDLVAVRSGYHPVVTAPGYDLYYLNVMAGPIREWRFREDPAHAWVAEKWRAEL